MLQAIGLGLSGGYQTQTLDLQPPELEPLGSLFAILYLRIQRRITLHPTHGHTGGTQGSNHLLMPGSLPGSNGSPVCHSRGPAAATQPAGCQQQQNVQIMLVLQAQKQRLHTRSGIEA